MAVTNSPIAGDRAAPNMPPAASDPAAPARCARPACFAGCRVRRLAWLSVLLTAIVALDQFSKAYAVQHWQHTALQPLVFADGHFRIQYAENPGAFLSLLGNQSPQVRFWVLTAGNLLLLLGVLAYLVLVRMLPGWQWWAFALILAGGIGNLIDRVQLEGRVIDFLLLSSGRWRVPYFETLQTGIFNIADIAITAGFLLWLPAVLLPEKTVAAPRVDTATASPGANSAARG